MSKRITRSFLMLVALAASVVSAGAQDPRTGSKLDEPSKAALRSVIDSARAQGLPTDPLMEKIYEGQGKGADGPRIVAAVRQLAFEMAVMHRALGAIATTDELKAAASALHAGVPAVELGKMKKESGLRRKLTLPFTVITDIVSRGVPVGAAVNAVKALVGAGAKDKDINDFQRNVKEDIQQGAPPAAAAETRAKSKPDKENPDQQQNDQ
ncbi:MAG: hypothetical protein ABIY52_18905 [Gemmatimonadaceae bacterium]